MGGLTVLSIAYALAPVAPDTAGGAEQVLAALDEALVAAGHNSLVVAAAGSRTAGTLLATPPLPAAFTDAARRRAETAQRRRVEAALRDWPVDVVHCHGLDFAEHLPPRRPPTLVTLHLAAEAYDAESLAAAGPGTWFNCVSAAQRAGFADCAAMLPVIENGVAVDALQGCHAKRSFVLALGRICPEKGFHIALEAAAIAGVPLLIGGRVFPYAAHQRYFAEAIRPRLGPGARFLGSLGFARKRRYLSAARCLLLPSLAPETSSLAAMEAIACGTPVVAFPSGALADIVEPGVSGFLVENARQMAAAIRRCDGFDRDRLRAIARRRFSRDNMVAAYLARYFWLAGQRCWA